HGQTVYYTRDELGRKVEKALPNGVTTYHKYDSASQVTDIIHLGSGGVLQSLHYKYADDGQRERIDREGGTRIYYKYDDAHRLTGEDWLDPSDNHIYGFAYEYDDAGNREKKTFNGEVTYYDYNNLNQLTTERVLGGEATYYTWTADGAMATKQEAAGWTYYTWDVDESLTKIEAPETTLESKYNARMQRVWRREDGAAEWLVYDAQKLVAEATTGGLERYYLSEGGSVYSPLVSQLGSQHWFQFDALGTTLGLTDSGGGLSDTFRYEAFGTSLGRTGTTETRYQYVGGYGYFREAGVGLEQVWWRWYENRTASWSAADPVELMKPYVYVDSSPASATDPMGLERYNPYLDPAFLWQINRPFYNPYGWPIPKRPSRTKRSHVNKPRVRPECPVDRDQRALDMARSGEVYIPGSPNDPYHNWGTPGVEKGLQDCMAQPLPLLPTVRHVPYPKR
ncbi:MAG: hypothetical protein ABFD96_01085, partial [Armatimonadia bacterium]